VIKELNIKHNKKIKQPAKPIIFVIIFIITILAAAYIYYALLYNSIEDKYYSAIKTAAVTQDNKIESWFNDWVKELKTIVNDSSITDFVSLDETNPSYKIIRDNIENSLHNYLAENNFSALDVIDNFGKTVYSSGIKTAGNKIKGAAGLNFKNHFAVIDTEYFLISPKNEIKLALNIPIIKNNQRNGSIYVEVNTEKAFGDFENNLLIKDQADFDICKIESLNLISLRSTFLNSIKQPKAINYKNLITYNHLIWLNSDQGIISFDDNDNNKQYAYVVKNNITGWVTIARDINKEQYFYLIEKLKNYFLIGIGLLLIVALLILVLWSKVLKYYLRSVTNDYELENLRVRFNHFSKFSNDVFFVLSLKGKILDFNEKAFSGYGYTDEELKELNISDLFTIKSRQKITNYFDNLNPTKNAAFNFEEGIVLDAEQVRKDKTVFKAELSLRKIKVIEHIRIQCIVRDISHRIEIENKLKESEEIFDLIVNNLNEVVYIFSIKPQKKFEYISSNINILTGYEHKEFASDPSLLLKIVHPDEKYKIKLLLEGKLEDKRPPVKFIKKDGSIVWVNHRSIPRKNDKNEVVALIGIFRDVTEQINSEKELSEREKSFRYLFDNNPIPMWLYQLESKQFLNVNQAAINHYGYSKDEFLKLSLNDILINDNDETNNSTNTSATKEYIHTIKNGNVITVEVNSQIVQLDGTQQEAVLEVLQDISERKRIESRITESEQRFKTLAKISPVAIFRTNNRGELTYMNDNWTDMTGVYGEIAFGRKWFEGLPTKDKDLIEQRWKRSTQISNNFETEVELTNPKSKVKWVLVGIVKISSSENKVMGYVGTLTDITRMKMFEGNFRKLYFSVEQSPVSVVITDKKGDIEYVNPAVVNATGYTKEELIGSNPKILNSGFQNKSFYKNLWDTISSGEVWRGDFHNKRKDGTYFWERASISPVFNDRAEIANFVAVKEDITQLKQLQDDLINAKNAAVESSRIKTNFLTKINHELRTPLVGILGSSNSIFEETTEKNIKELSEILIKESNRLNDSLKSILSFSSLETEKQNIQLEPIELEELLRNTYKRFSSKAELKNLKLSFNYNSNKTFVDAKPELLSESISILVDNAIKFTLQGSITVFYKLENDICTIFVKDTGIGINEESKHLIFEPFRSIENKYSGQGIGLGLTLAKKYIELMGGSLLFESKSKAGSIFYFTLKISKSVKLPEKVEAIAVSQQIKTSTEKLKKKLLLVEDDDINLRVTQMYLKSMFDISIATNSTETLEQIEKQSFDIILMDIGLKQGLNGMELTKILRKMPEYEKIPIVAITAFTQAKDRADIMSAGCSHYLAKPFKKEDLIQIVQTALS